MKFLLFSLLLLLSGTSFGQTLDEAEQLFLKYKTADALDICEKLAKNDSTAGAANYMTGKIYCSVRNYNGAIPVLQKAIETDRDRTYVSGWSHAYLGECYYHLGDYKNEAAELKKAIELNKSDNSVVFAESMLMGMLVEQKRFDQAEVLARQLMQKNIVNPEPYLVLGVVNEYRNRPDSAVYYLHEAIKLNDDKNWVSALAHLHLGETYISVGDLEDAAYELNNTVRMNKTPNAAKEAKQILDSLNYLSPVESSQLRRLSAPKWVTIEGVNITYNFQDTVGMGAKVQIYIAEHELAYLKINEVFHATLPKKMSLYVWNDPDLARIVLGHKLGVSNPRVCVSNVAYNDAVGHEMTHTLWFWGLGGPPGTNITRLINEGVAVAFDQSGSNRIDDARKALRGKNFKSILDFWKNDETDENIFNPIAGAFVAYLYQKSTPEQFKSVVKNQSQANAEATYGAAEFNKLISQFNKLIGLK